MTKFGMVTRARGACLLAGQPRGRGPSVSNILDLLHTRAHGMKNSNQI